MLRFRIEGHSLGNPLKRLLVTGGHGFVGQWVQRRAPPIGAADGFQIALPAADFDLLDSARVDATLAASRPDAILHLAAQSNVAASFKDPAGTFRVNAMGTLALFEGVKRAGLRPRIVLVSSGDVYGLVPAAEMPIAETRLPMPRNPYAASKVAAEALAYQWSQSEGLEVVIARSFNHIGAGQADTFAISGFARQIAEIEAGKRDAFIDAGDIDATRDFTHVSDIVEGYFTLFAKGASGEVYNLCSGTDRRIRDLLERMLGISGVRAAIRQDPARLRPSEQRAVRGNNGKISRLGWRPQVEMDAALREVLDDWKKRI